MDNMYALPNGYLLKERYLIQKTVGWEAAGINYEAVDVRWNQRVMVREYFLNGSMKRLGAAGTIMIHSEKIPLFENGRKEFLRESRVLVSVIWNNHSHIAEAFDYFEDNHTVYLVTKYLVGFLWIGI